MNNIERQAEVSKMIHKLKNKTVDIEIQNQRALFGMTNNLEEELDAAQGLLTYINKLMNEK